MTRLAHWLLLLVAIATPAQARFEAGFPEEMAEAEFETATQGHVLNVQRVGVIRGMPQQKATTLTIASVAQVLARTDADTSYHPKTRLLFYSTDGGNLTAWLIDAQGLIAASKSPLAPQQLSNAAMNLRLSLNVDGIARSRSVRLRGEGTSSRKPRTQLDQDVAVLSDLLLPRPIRDGLKGSKHLLVIAGGSITSLPLAIMRLDRKTMLIDRMTVSVSPGLYDFGLKVRHWDAARAFARPVIVGNPEVFPSPQWEVPSLPGAEQEAQAFSGRLGVPALTGPEARKDVVMSQLDSASLLYFAAHGVASPDNPVAGGFLMLAGDDEESGFLRASEVQRRKLAAALVVLSACQSGLGMPHDGGMIGLTRSFRSAGVPRIVMSLWSVSDEATVVLMDRFQRHLAVHMPSTALRKAMLETREIYPEPKYWAPFALYGTPR